MTVLQLCCWKFSHKVTLQQTLFRTNLEYVKINAFRSVGGSLSVNISVEGDNSQQMESKD